MFIRYVYERVLVRKRSALPHWHVPNGLYFVTWRLAGSLPREEEMRLAEMRKQLDALRSEKPDDRSVRTLEREIFRVMERGLDRPQGEAHMLRDDVAGVVVSSLEHPDGTAYDLVNYSVMPNHVHVVFRLLTELDAVMRAWKSVTAHRANALLGRRGSFWADDYFDVLIRNSRQLERIVRYVQNNASKAGLYPWKWQRTFPDVYATLV